MRALAEYVMRGRIQALWVAVLAAVTGLLSWLSAAIIALVVLRKGIAEGSYILMWAILPAGTLLYLGETGPLGMMFGTAILAIVLRWTGSWSLMLMVSIAVGVLTGLLLIGLGAGYLAEIAELFEQFIEQLQQQLSEQGEKATLQAPGVIQIAGLLGLMGGVSSVLCLMLARWWQALLYNPEGFGLEFRAIRLSPMLTLGLVVSGIALSSLGVEYRPWGMLFALPLVVASFALVHWGVKHKQVPSHWLFTLYMLWLFFDVVKAGLLLLAVVDSWLDFRSRSRNQ